MSITHGSTLARDEGRGESRQASWYGHLPNSHPRADLSGDGHLCRVPPAIIPSFYKVEARAGESKSVSFLSPMLDVRRMSAVPGIRTYKPDDSLGPLSGIGLELVSGGEACIPDV